jgi:hypothetical protein
VVNDLVHQLWLYVHLLWTCLALCTRESVHFLLGILLLVLRFLWYERSTIERWNAWMYYCVWKVKYPQVPVGNMSAIFVQYTFAFLFCRRQFWAGLSDGNTNTNFDICLKALEWKISVYRKANWYMYTTYTCPFGIYNGLLVYLMVIWYIFNGHFVYI